MAQNPRDILVIDQTIREGMQHRGIMFGFNERMRMIRFQNQLKVDISQAAYPPAHDSEQAVLSQIIGECANNAYGIAPAGLCRAKLADIKPMMATGVTQFHLHSGVSKAMTERWGEDKIRSDLTRAVQYIRDHAAQPTVQVTLIDVGKTDLVLLRKLASYLMNDLQVDMLTLPDTSGIIQPMRYYEVIADICKCNAAGKTLIGVHCHNDLGLANANTILGVLAGASFIEVSALGIGERNGIGDLFVVGSVLQNEGFHLRLGIKNAAAFRAYYGYVNQLVFDQIGEQLLHFNTPYFGAAAISHVAGTHGMGHFGLKTEAGEPRYYFNVLTGKNNIKHFAAQNRLVIDDYRAAGAAQKVKELSVRKGRRLTAEEVVGIIRQT